MPHFEPITYEDGEFIITTDPARLDFKSVYDFLANRSYWATDIPEDILRRAIDNSLCFHLYHGDKLAGFARVISDYAAFAWISDVFILEDYRGRGLSKWLLECIESHPGLQNLRLWLLGTKDAHGLYERYGGFKMVDPSRFMERRDKDLYQRLKASRQQEPPTS